ncbi:MAG: CRISPR-associated endonuclease Cas1 [Fimbriimonadaceae bacterium]|nr:CRISPR-associated endonuclease Cas1 [Fimbriimonadaceae bacterium]
MIVYVDRFDADLRKDDDEIVVRTPDGERRVPIRQVERLLLCTGASVSSDLLVALVRLGVPTAFLARDGHFLGRLEGPDGGRVARLRAQFSVSPARRLEFARALVAAKRDNQEALLRAAARNRRIGESFAALPDPDLSSAADAESLLGLEGLVARAYWAALRTLIPAEWGFVGRAYRPAPDAVNAALNYLYAILRAEVEQGVHRAGLHPDAGFLHADRPGRPSLALDLMEPFRPWLADRIAVRLFAQKRFAPTDFESDEVVGWSLVEAGRERLVAEFFAERAKGPPACDVGARTTWPDALAEQSERLARALLGGEPFRPVRVWSR